MNKDLHCMPVVFHNSSGYDAHFVAKEIATYEGRVKLSITMKKRLFSDIKLSSVTI